MNTQLSLVLDEICLKGSVGISLASLWASLSSIFPITHSTKQHLWNSIRGIATLSFSLSDNPVNPSDPRIQKIEDVEETMMRITANESLRDCFLGLYDVSSSELPENQRLALERIALARDKGIAQSQLGKEFGIEGNSFFYIIKKLEARGLIVRQQAVIKTLETGGGVEYEKNLSCVTTNLIYLHRYAKNLTGLQRLEIKKEARVMDTFNNEEECNFGTDLIGDNHLKDDVSVKDYLPEMKSICEKLEHAPGKVLVIRDIKRDLHYSGCFGHRAWRLIRNRLKDANLVEEFDGSVNGKLTRCLRLLKSMSSPEIQCTADDSDDKNVIKFGRKVQLSDQTLELAIDHQIYDMIDQEGSKGALLLEVCRKLGLDRKKNDSRLKSIIKRYGMHQYEEGHKKTGAYRLWTSKYPNSIYSELLKNSKNSKVNRTIESDNVGGSHPVQNTDLLTTSESKQIFTNLNEKNELNGSKEAHVCPESSLALLGNTEPRKSSSRPSINIHGALREQRILDKLKNEKFILRSELPRWLSSFEKDKKTSIDRKTVDRILTRLENQGSCKRVCLNIPAISNCGRIRSTIVILDSSVQNSLPDLSCQILDRIRSFEREISSMSSAKTKTNDLVPVLDIKRIKISQPNEGKNVQTDANHTPLAKMVCAKLLHRFLWSYVRGLSVWDESLLDRNSHTNYKPFSLEAAKRDMPIELLYLIVRSSSLHDKMWAKNYAGGFRLSDLPIEEYRYMMDANVIKHLSRGLEILRRLKLIRLIHGKQEDEGDKFSVNFTHALEMNPYIEEPPSMIETHVSHSPDLRPRIRHDFVLQNEDLFNDYWNTLEYCYAASDSKIGLHSFPGSVVPEVFHYRSWTSVKGLSENNHSEILKIISKYSLKEKLPFQECEKLARDLNITLHQVLSVYYGNCHVVSNATGFHDGSGSFKNIKRLKRKRLLFANSSEKLRRCANAVDRSTERESILKHDYNTELESYEHSAMIIRPSVIKKDENDISAESLRFIWNDETDRCLVMQYARNRASMGATHQRVDWTKIVNLPAKRKACIKRMCFLKRNREFRKALMKFCTFLCQRYARELEDLLCNSDENHINENSNKSSWDDFNDESVKKALDDVLFYKQIAKPTKHKLPKLSLESFNLKNPSGIQSDDLSGQNLHSENHLEGRHCLHQNFIDRCNIEKRVLNQLHSSLAISNVVELLKLIFLNTLVSSKLELGITETLRNYSEHDLFAGFSYLRDKKIVIGGNGGAFFLSRHFMQRLQKSPFPHNTGNRASQFSNWISENDHQLSEGVQLSSALECGDLFHLFFLLSLGDFSLSPLIPEKGVGEAEERLNGKRKSEDVDSQEPERSRKMKFFNENDPFFRRDKGFPGLIVSLHRTGFSFMDTLSLASNSNAMPINLTPCEGQDEIFKQHDESYELPNSNSVDTTDKLPPASCWEEMVNYINYVNKSASLNLKTAPYCDVFKSMYNEIQMAGDQGLELKKIKDLLPSHLKNSCEEIVETLITFQRVIKVNAYDSIRFVDALHRPKYFISYGNEKQCKPLRSESEISNAKNDNNDLHKVTFLNGPCLDSMQHIEKSETTKDQVPILPWFNGNGSVNKEVYGGLVRRIMGIVMQNPGILKDSIIQLVDVLNPQSCRCLLDSMILDNYVIVKKMHQSVFRGSSSLLRSILKSDVKEEEFVYREHFFANCKFSSML